MNVASRGSLLVDLAQSMTQRPSDIATKLIRSTRFLHIRNKPGCREPKLRLVHGAEHMLLKAWPAEWLRDFDLKLVEGLAEGFTLERFRLQQPTTIPTTQINNRPNLPSQPFQPSQPSHPSNIRNLHLPDMPGRTNLTNLLRSTLNRLAPLSYKHRFKPAFTPAFTHQPSKQPSALSVPDLNIVVSLCLIHAQWGIDALVLAPSLLCFKLCSVNNEQLSASFAAAGLAHQREHELHDRDERR